MRSLLMILTAAALITAPIAHADAPKVRVGWCARVLSSIAAPYAVAQKMGWFAAGGIDVEVVPIGGSVECMKLLSTGQIDYAGADVSAVALFRAKGLNAKVFYQYIETNILGIAVPANSEIRVPRDLKGKAIGVIAMGAAGVLLARAVTASAGLDPEKDIRIVVVGEGVQPVTFLRRGEIDALSQYDAQYAIIENAGVGLRLLEDKETEQFPSNGMAALEDTLQNRRSQAIALARGYAMGTLFTLANPEAAIRTMWDMYPATKPTGKSESDAIRHELHIIETRVPKWLPRSAGVTRWGECSEKNYQAYLKFLAKNGIVTQSLSPGDVCTNDLIAEINRFEEDKISSEARAYRPR